MLEVPLILEPAVLLEVTEGVIMVIAVLSQLPNIISSYLTQAKISSIHILRQKQKQVFKEAILSAVKNNNIKHMANIYTHYKP